MEFKEVAKELRNKLKEVGYNRTVVAVKTTDYEIKVIIKNENIEYNQIKDIVNKYNSKSIIIELDDTLKENLANSFEKDAEVIFNTRNENNCLNVFAENENYKILYCWRDELLFVEDKKANVSFPMMMEKLRAENVNHIKYHLARIYIKYKIKC